MAGIYIHIPFCKQACHYCNFHFSTSLVLKDEVVKSLVGEIGIRSSSADTEISIIKKDEEIETIYFGGGTPSLLCAAEIELILKEIYRHHAVSAEVEITLEANPDDINLEKLKGWKMAGVNRLSIGIQSFENKDLVWMNRAHDSSQALNCISLVREAGFENISIDLIFGTPGLNNEEWKRNVETVIQLGIPHIACYALTVEPKTALQKMIILKKKENINADQQASQYSMLMEMMQNAGYEHYEISNFAKPGFRSRHNSSYWQGKKYIGIGPSAHSYNGKERMWNTANNVLYSKAIQQQTIPFEKEILSNAQKLDEYIMISLRTIEGMNLAYIEQSFSPAERERIEKVINEKVGSQLYKFVDENMVLTNEGKLLADAISVQLFS